MKNSVISHEELENNGFNIESSDKYTKEYDDFYIMLFLQSTYAKAVIETDDFMHDVFIKTLDQLDDFLSLIKKHGL